MPVTEILAIPVIFAVVPYVIVLVRAIVDAHLDPFITSSIWSGGGMTCDGRQQRSRQYECPNDSIAMHDGFLQKDLRHFKRDKI